ncbi:MAG: hypothetical protein CMM60_04220 [Rhodospirillaceae bacterium]|nr:hypothetical protein [Rhodospirillaceae bacterium]
MDADWGSSMGKGFRLILAVVAISICVGGVVGGGRPAAAGEMTPETEKLFRAVRSNDFPAVKRILLDGGDVRAENAAGLTVIDLAIDKGYFNIAHYLLAWRKQRKPKPKIPLPLPAPPPITAEAAPTTEPVPPEPAREAAPIAPKPPQSSPATESAAKPTPTPIETATKPEPLPKTDPVESPGILDRITGFFTSDPEPKAPDPKPLAEESRPAPETAAEDKPETPAEQAAASAIAAPEEEKAPEGPGVFDQIARFFSPETEPEDHPASQSEAKPEPAAKAAVRETPKLLPENAPAAEPVREAAEKLTPSPPEKPEDRSGIIARIQDMLSVGPEKEAPPASRPGETASIPTSAPAPRPIPEPIPSGSPGVKAPAVPKTTSIEPFIGTSMKLGKRWQKDAAHTCVGKPSQKRSFCIEPVDWPREIGPSFQVHTTLYRGRKSIVRYDGEVATQFHTLFPTGNFDVIVEHFSKLFGPPTEKPVIWTVMIGKPNRKNRTAQWVGPQRAGGKNGDQGAAPGILEVREIDDLRWSSPPDDRHGAVWLYRKGGLPVFRHVSWSDFLLARVRRQPQ